MKINHLVITALTVAAVLVSCNKRPTYTVDGVIEDLNTTQNSENLKEMFNDPEFYTWLVDLPSGEQSKIEETMEYNYVRLQLGVEGVINELNKANSLHDLYWTYEDYDQKWIWRQSTEDQRKIVDALFNKALHTPVEIVDDYDIIYIINKKLNFCETPEEVDSLKNTPDFKNWISQQTEEDQQKIYEPFFKRIDDLKK